MSVLLVEDDFLVAAALSESLAGADLSVEVAHTDRDAYNFLKDPERSFSVLVTDIDLGPGTDGFDVARAARAAHPGIPVIYITGHASHQSHLGVEGSVMMAKPFSPQELTLRVKQLALH